MRLLSITLAACLVLTGCGGDSDSSTGANDTTSSSTSAAPSSSTSSSTTTPERCAATVLSIVNAEATDGFSGSTADDLGIVDGPLDVAWAMTESGPHPDNTTDEDRSLVLGIATFDIPADDQFGHRIPLDADSPEGEHFVRFSFASPEGVTVGAGMLFVDQVEFEDRADADGKLNHQYWEVGDERILFGRPDITVVEMTDETVCFTITTRTETDLQSFVGLEGTIVADRQQYLRALEDA